MSDVPPDLIRNLQSESNVGLVGSQWNKGWWRRCLNRRCRLYHSHSRRQFAGAGNALHRGWIQAGIFACGRFIADIGSHNNLVDLFKLLSFAPCRFEAQGKQIRRWMLAYPAMCVAGLGGWAFPKIDWIKTSLGQKGQKGRKGGDRTGDSRYAYTASSFAPRICDRLANCRSFRSSAAA